MKRVLFIIPPYVTAQGYAQRSFVTMPYGALSLASYIKDIAESRIFDLNIRVFDDFAPDVVCISLMFDVSYQYLPQIIKEIREGRPNLPIVVGGAAATHNYKQILNDNPDISAVCVGDGELPLRDYILTGKFGKGWATREQEPERNNITDLDSCIDIDYSIIQNLLKYYLGSIEEAYSPYIRGKQDKRQFVVITSRGCPYSCTFCMNSMNPDKVVRYASVDSIIKHIEKLIETYGMNVLTFYDDQILYDGQRALELFTRLKPYGLRIEMPNGVNVAGLNEPVIKAMREAGVDTIYLALESGSKEMLKAMRKPVSLDKAREVMKLLRKYDFFVFCFLVIGLPEETDAHRQETINFIREIEPDLINPKPASPVYGSALRKQCIEAGYIKDAPFGEYEMMTPVIKTPTNDPVDILKQAQMMMYRTNFIENYRMKIGDYAAAKHYFGYVAGKYPDEIFAHMYYAEALFRENKNNAQEKVQYFMTGE
jgi:radical SAM superfamily enzyme YgiQ (UPF0313 family)